MTEENKNYLKAKALLIQTTKTNQKIVVIKFRIENKDWNYIIDNKYLGVILKTICELEDQKYDIETKPWLLGRRMLFYSWIYPCFKEHLHSQGFTPKLDELKKAERFKYGKTKSE